jgi:hypothetical protein
MSIDEALRDELRVEEVSDALCALPRPRGVRGETKEEHDSSACGHHPPDGMGCGGEVCATGVAHGYDRSGDGNANGSTDLAAGGCDGGGYACL